MASEEFIGANFSEEIYQELTIGDEFYDNCDELIDDNVIVWLHKLPN